MKRSFVSAFALAISLPAVPAHAESVEETAAVFGMRQQILDISLSPSGDKVAMVSAGPQGSEVLNVIDLRGSAEVKPILTVNEQDTDLNYCDWATEDRIVCQAYVVNRDAGLLLGFSRLLSVGDNGEDVQILTARDTTRALGARQNGGNIVALDVPGETDRILMTKSFVPERTVGTRTANSSTGLGVESVDVRNGRRSIVERPDDGVAFYVADGTGRIRLRASRPDETGGYVGERVVYHFRDPNSDRWNLLSTGTVEAQGNGSGFRASAVDAERNVAYGFLDEGGYDAIAEVPLVVGGQPKVIMSRDDVDVDSLIRIGRQRRIVGASYASEKRAVEYFDSELDQFAKALQAALPGKPLVNIVGANGGESKLLLVASSDTDPGTAYLYNKATKELNELLPVRNFMAGRQMAEMKPVSFPASDGTMIPGYLTMPVGSNGRSLRAVVMPHGGPSARDEWGFDWLVQFFAARGYAVLQPNYRGSAGYGDAWFGKNGFQAWETAIGDVNDAGRWLVKQGIAKADELAVVGWSYGGYAALQSQVLDPDLYKAVVAIAPVTDLAELREDSRSYTNYKLVDEFIGSGPHVTAGSPARHAEGFAAPVMLVHGTMDQNVDVDQSRSMAAKLRAAGKRVEYVEYDGLDHSLSDSKARAEMLVKVDAFLNGSFGQ